MSSDKSMTNGTGTSITIVDHVTIIEEIEASLETRLHHITADRVVTVEEVQNALEILLQLAGTLPRLYQHQLEKSGEDLATEANARSILEYEAEIEHYYTRIIIGENTFAAHIQQYTETARYLTLPKNALLGIQRVLLLALQKIDKEKNKETGFYAQIIDEIEREDILFTETRLRDFVALDLSRKTPGDALYLGISEPGYLVLQCFHTIVKKYNDIAVLKVCVPNFYSKQTK